MKAGNTIVLVVLAAGLLAAPASAGMFMDIDPSSGSGSTTYAMAVGSGTASITGLKLNIRLTSNGGSGDLALLKFNGKVVSTNVGGGLILGTLSDAWAPGTPLSTYAPVTGLGTAQELDADGDIDIGGTSTSSPTGWMLAQQGSTLYVTQTDATNGIPAYTIGFTGTGWVNSNPHGVTVLQALQRTIGTNLYKEGTVGATGATTGYTITLYRPDDAMLDKGTLDLSAGGSGTLDASASIGSLDQWQWDVNGDGTYEVKTASALVGYMMTFTVYPSGLVEWNDGAGDSGSFMPTPAQAAAGKLTVKLRTKYGNDVTPLASGMASATLLLPEPATMALLGLGGLALVIRRRRPA